MIINNSVYESKLRKQQKTKRDFELTVYEELEKTSKIEWYSSGRYEITTNKGYRFNYYPYNNTILCLQSKTKHTDGLKWIINNLI